MSLVSLIDMKAYLGVTDTASDVFLQTQLDLISETIEAYCQRRFSKRSYRETFYRPSLGRGAIFTANYPVVSVSSITYGMENLDFRIHRPTGRLFGTADWPSLYGQDAIVVEYVAGYDSVPAPIRQAVFNLVSQRFTSKQSGVNLDFGSDVQSVTIPGTITIAYDYSLQNNEEKEVFGSTLGNSRNSLAPYKSDRALLGESEYRYVEELP